jgi:hypothetical protein
MKNSEVSKICSGCKTSKALETEYSRCAKSKDGYQNYCKECARLDIRQWRLNNIEKRQQYEKIYQSEHKEFYYQQGIKYRTENKEKVKEVQRSYAAKNPERCMISDAKKRSKKRSVPLTITYKDIKIPEICPVLGIPLKRNLNGGKPSDNSPALDAVIPQKGYIPGNIAVISHRGNRIKTDATLDELKKVTDWLEKMTLETTFST